VFDAEHFRFDRSVSWQPANGEWTSGWVPRTRGPPTCAPAGTPERHRRSREPGARKRGGALATHRGRGSWCCCQRIRESRCVDPVKAVVRVRFLRIPPGLHDAAGSGIIGCDMAEYGEWSRKGATLSDVTAGKEYGVDADFIVKGINAGKLEYREGAVHGNPYIRVLRRQLEASIVEGLGDDHLRSWQAKTELREIRREMAQLRKRLDELEARRAQLEGRH
jgi:hypothetical protein